MSTPATLGARIAQARRELAVRKRRDIGQADIAKALHATPTSVSEWEADKKVPREATLNRLAAFLEVTPAYLRYGIEGAQPSTSVTMTPEIVAGRGSPAEPIERKKRA